MASKLNLDLQYSAYSEKLLVIFSALCTILMLGWVLWFCRNGIDFADEGFYLAWIASPSKYRYSTTQFGFVYHPLYLLIDGSISALRQINVFVTFVLAAILTNLTIKATAGNLIITTVTRYIIACAFSTSAFIFMVLWLPTPSYNWLAFQSILIAAIGFILSEKAEGFKSIFGWILIGVGGWLSFMAKPTTAAILCFCAVFYILSAKKFNPRLFAVSILTAFLLLGVSAFAIDGSLFAFINRLRGGLQQAVLMGSGHNPARLLRIDDFDLGKTALSILIAATVFFFFMSYLVSLKPGILASLGHLLSIASGLPVLAMIFGIYHTVIVAGGFQHLLIWAVPLAAILLGFSLIVFKGGLRFQASRAQWALAVTLSMLPYAFAFGTSNNYWWFGGMVGVFWVLAGIVILQIFAWDKRVPGALAVLGMAVQLVTSTQIMSGMEGPYYQPSPLRTMSYRVELGSPKSKLFLAESFGIYISDAINLANRSGFKPGTPMIDLSGHSPGVLYSIGASNTGLPWIIGNYSKNSGFAYSGSEKIAIDALKATSCEELSSAWLLTEPDGPVNVSSKILETFGAHIETDFEVVGSFETAPIVGGFADRKVQYMLKPIRSVNAAVKSCIDAKAREK